jgi:hypothetical protein
VSCKRVIKLPHIRLLYFFLSSGLRSVTYAESNAGFCR